MRFSGSRSKSRSLDTYRTPGWTASGLLGAVCCTLTLVGCGGGSKEQQYPVGLTNAFFDAFKRATSDIKEMGLAGDVIYGQKASLFSLVADRYDEGTRCSVRHCTFTVSWISDEETEGIDINNPSGTVSGLTISGYRDYEADLTRLSGGCFLASLSVTRDWYSSEGAAPGEGPKQDPPAEFKFMPSEPSNPSSGASDCAGA